MTAPIADKNRAGFMGPAHVRTLNALQAKADLGVLTTLTSGVTATSGQRLMVNTAGGAVTINLPAAPALDDELTVFRNGATNAVTIGRNGSTIEGLSEDLIINEDKKGVKLKFLFSTWKIVEVFP